MECEKYAKQKGWDIKYRIYERGVSAFKNLSIDRDAVFEVCDLVEEGKIDHVLCFKIDRFAREFLEAPIIITWMNWHGVSIISTVEGERSYRTNTDGAMSYFALNQANTESQNIALRTKTKMSHMGREGLWLGGAIHFGYQLHTRADKAKEICICEETAPIIREIFSLYCNSGLGYIRIAKICEEKFPTAKHRWTRDAIQRILKEPFYTGRLLPTKGTEDIGGSMEPIIREDLRIISDEVFELAKKISVSHAFCREWKAEDEAVATVRARLGVGIIKCGYCGKNMRGTRYQYRRKDVFSRTACYDCEHKRKFRDKHPHEQTTYRAEPIDTAINICVRSYLKTLSSLPLDTFTETMMSDRYTALKQQMKYAKDAKASAEKRLNNMQHEIELSLDGKSSFTKETLGQIVPRIESELASNIVLIDKLQQEINEHECKRTSYEHHYNDAITWADVYDKEDEDGKRMILLQIIDRVEVRKGPRVNVVFQPLPATIYEEITKNIQASTVDVHIISQMDGAE
jgi:DNA invertase Pin-like site-specific DNA recombinase